jgi:DNA-directed RNA polymerase subunit M/transcription elongation factor TFIIS
MIAQGYHFGAPTMEAEEIDAEVASGIKCPKCGGPMYYEGYHRRTQAYCEYIALAVCTHCGYAFPF